ncbi:YopX family protein [Brevibacillus laterosporus]|uniref:YopX family protein n=1 Tax=Brevibacillus laterosporus TaxID=1465 RepID=UPI00241FAB94|nr:YopX family protein [Brevibacillus laterosporus]
MREIKFRIWDKANEIIIQDDGHFYITADGDVIGVNDDLDISESVILMQYTGLHDKNGKEIYEGDILDCTCELLTNFGRTRTGKMGTTIYEVFWRDEGWRERVIRSDSLVSGKDSDGVAVTAKYSKVIGNIYEHPNLLQVGGE